MCNENRFMESLESRTLLSVSPAQAALNATVQADRLQVRADLLKFKSDVVGLPGTLLADMTALKHDHLGNDPTIKPLVKTMRADIAKMRFTLLGDRLAEKSNVLADESAIVAVERRLLLDKGNPTAVAADRAALLADRVKLQQDMVAGLDKRITDRQTFFNTVFNDGQAIITALQNDSNASPQLTADLTKWINDKTAGMTTLTADLQKLSSDRDQLVAELTAMQSSQA